MAYVANRAGNIVTRMAACAVAALLLMAGCTNIVPPLYGYELGEANSAVFSYDYDTHDIMVVLTSVSGACELMTTDSQPMSEGDWVVSTWRTTSSYGGYFATYRGGQLEEHEAIHAVLEDLKVPSSSDASGGKPAKGKMSLRFDSGDEVEFRFEAYYCSRDLFSGL